MTFFALFKSHLRYALSFLRFLFFFIYSIFNLQKSLRYTFGLEYQTHCRSYFIKKTYGILFFIYTRINFLNIQTYFRILEKNSLYQHRTINKVGNNIYLLQPRLELTKNSIFYNFNHLSSHFKSLTAYPVFQKAVKSYFLDKPFY